MNKIFYNPITNTVLGMSDGEVCMQYPYIETAENFHSLENVKVEKSGKKMTLKIEANIPTEIAEESKDINQLIE